MKACKHLDHESEYINCELKNCAPHFPAVKYWFRHSVPDVSDPTKVQFCKERGRIAGIFQCYNANEMPCYEV